MQEIEHAPHTTVGSLIVTVNNCEKLRAEVAGLTDANIGRFVARVKERRAARILSDEARAKARIAMASPVVSEQFRRWLVNHRK